MPESQESDLITLTSQIVSAHVSHNAVDPEELPKLIKSVYTALGNAKLPEPVTSEPAVPVKASVKPGSITCLECGGVFKMLKRHITTEHAMTVDGYRQKFSLPASYPLVAPDYAKVRSTLAKKIGLGRFRDSAPAARKRAGSKRRAG